MTTPECIKCGHLAPHGHVPAYTCPRCLCEVQESIQYRLKSIDAQMDNLRKELDHFEMIKDEGRGGHGYMIACLTNRIEALEGGKPAPEMCAKPDDIKK